MSVGDEKHLKGFKYLYSQQMGRGGGGRALKTQRESRGNFVSAESPTEDQSF